MVEKKLVMIPGPTPVVKSIQDAMGREVQAFGDPRFVADYKKLIDDLGVLLNCSGMTFPLAGTGTCAMEMAIANVTKRGDNILIVSHGFFGDRFIEIAERKGLNVDVMRAEWGKIIPVEEIEAQLKTKNYAAMTVSHVDTATGVLAPIAEIGEMMKKFPETVYIVDGVAATGGEFADVDGMNIDILFTGSQKAFGVSPGMFILWASKKALQRRKDLGMIPEYYVDFEKWIPIMENPAKYFATPAVNLVWAMAEATRIINAEGYKARAERHAKNACAMRKALTTLGFTVLAEEGHRASTLSNLVYPEGLDDAKFRGALYDEGIIVAGGLAQYAGRMFRLGHMGNIDINDEVAVLGVIERALVACGVEVEYGKSVGVYLAEMAK
ncbi:MAG: alanine--glyoxylate aminotransferase family protein [Oscillospiraceae bacterium]|nr:alanine--glyoxylate aminotransferase family protein [Oscillospiraceae bacterium]MBR6738331.1 alanine--glyoxylate aminotransferase family protein [Oscillospiraceae bacterium]